MSRLILIADGPGQEAPAPAVSPTAGPVGPKAHVELEEARPARGAGSLRLTSRGRLVVVLLALLIGLVVGFAGGRADAAAPQDTQEVLVESGDTLWELAGRVATPGEDLRDVVIEIQRLNGLRTSDLAAGQVLLLPVP
jgi:hypothetical protein